MELAWLCLGDLLNFFKIINFFIINCRLFVNMSSADSVIILHIMILIVMLTSGVGQIILASSTVCHKCLPLGMLRLSILSHVLNVIILGFTDLRSDLHHIVLVWSVVSGSLQVVALGLLTQKKSSHVSTDITLIGVWFRVRWSLNFVAWSSVFEYP